MAAQLGPTGQVGGLAHHRRVVQLEVAAVDYGAHGCANGQAAGVGDAMGDPHELHLEGSQGNLLAGAHRSQVGPLEELVLLELDRYEAAGEPGAVDGHPQLAQDIRQGAGVVLVAVGDDDGSQLLLPLADVGDVGDHQVNPQHLLLGEHEAGVDDDHVLGELQHHHVLADLSQATQRDYPQFVFSHSSPN